MTEQSTAMKRMIKARALMIMTPSTAFYGVLALHLVLVEDDSVDTMEVDGKSLFFNPAFVEMLSDDEIIGVIVHEVSHCAMRHHTRRGDRDLKQWNEAADFAINRDILQAGFVLPKCALFDKRFDGMNAEQIYAILDSEKDDTKPEPQKGNDPGGCGGVRDAADPEDKAALAEQDAEWNEHVRVASGVGKRAGTLPGSAAKIVQIADQPLIDWKAITRRFIDSMARQDYSFARPDRMRASSGFIFPRLIPDGVSHLVFIIDDSGSIDRKALSQALAEVQAALDEGVVDKLTVAHCDTEIHGVVEYQRGDLIVPQYVRMGGTMFSPAFEWIAENAPDARGIIYFTDLECSDFGDEPAVPVLWAVYGSPGQKHEVPFGEVIEII